MFASHGVKVKGVDVRNDICTIINHGGTHIIEPGLREIVRDVVKSGMLSVSTKISHCDRYIIAVPTPLTSDKRADLSYVLAAASEVAGVIGKGDLVILESTVPPCCTENKLIPKIEQSGLKAGTDFMVAYCPERVLPGQIIHELKHNSRIIGGINRVSAEAARDLYAAFVEGEMYLTDTITAEMCKLMENTFRDVNIALANELAKLCERLGINAWEVIKYASKHPRVNLHQPGPGVGGHCIGVDPWFLVEIAPDIAGLIGLARRTNDSMPHYVYSRIRGILRHGGKVVLLGCTYKPDVDDIRESPIMKLYELLEGDEEIETVVTDPFADGYSVDVYEALKGADLAVLGVHHSAYKDLDLNRMKVVMRSANILDTRNFFDPDKVRNAGFNYYLLGCGDNK